LNEETSSNLDRIPEAREALAIAKKEKSGLSIAFVETYLPTKFEDGLEPYLRGLRKAGLF
jgi:hypothetical protein